MPHGYENTPARPCKNLCGNQLPAGHRGHYCGTCHAQHSYDARQGRERRLRKQRKSERKRSQGFKPTCTELPPDTPTVEFPPDTPTFTATSSPVPVAPVLQLEQAKRRRVSYQLTAPQPRAAFQLSATESASQSEYSTTDSEPTQTPVKKHKKTYKCSICGEYGHNRRSPTHAEYHYRILHARAFNAAYESELKHQQMLK